MSLFVFICLYLSVFVFICLYLSLFVFILSRFVKFWLSCLQNLYKSKSPISRSPQPVNDYRDPAKRRLGLGRLRYSLSLRVQVLSIIGLWVLNGYQRP